MNGVDDKPAPRDLSLYESLASMEGIAPRAQPQAGVMARLPGAAQARALYPGLIAAGTIALAATWLSQNYNAPVMLFALLLGMAFAFLSEDARCAPGVNFASRSILRLGVALLGLRISVGQIVDLGVMPVTAVVCGVASTLALGVLLARLMGLRNEFGVLSGGAVGICGASAALAISAALPAFAQKERDTVLTVIGVTTLSTVAMVIYPSLAQWLGLSATEAGVFIGASVHDVAQVVGAGYTISQQAGDVSTYVKLMRVAMLAPVVALLSVAVFRSARKDAGRAPALPAFLVAFCMLVALNSAVDLPEGVREAATKTSNWCLVAAIAALGMKTSLRELSRVGWRPVLLIGAETIWIAALALGVIFAFR
jgi:uncharacterized integral membrane protein (TIGR00698 family)